MAYDEKLAGRVAKVLDGRDDVVSKKMFGGLAFMVGGHMTVGVVGEELMVRVGPDAHADALKRPHARPMDFTGRPMKGMVYVGAAGTKAMRDLRGWVSRGLAFTEALPPKSAEKAKPSRLKKKPPKKKAAAKRKPAKKVARKAKKAQR